MKINRELAIKILKYLNEHPEFYFPFLVMCKEYPDEDDDFAEIDPKEWKIISDNDKHQTFELWENLQNLDEETLELMAKGFIDKIVECEITIRHFIFYTTEGFTFQPNSVCEIPEIENCQVLGWESGNTAREAFDNFKKENIWLEKLKFKNIIGVELKSQKIYDFNLEK
jgi:hypothetical protein